MEYNYKKYKLKYYNLKNQLGGEIIDILTDFSTNPKLLSLYPKYKDKKYNITLLKSLVDKIIDNNTKCNDSKNKNMQLLCKTIKLYLPFPIERTNLLRNSGILGFLSTTKINSGAFGDIYKFKIDDKNVILKIPKEVDINTINEAFVNLCIINDYILLNDNHHLVFTYGLFFCNISRSGENIKMCDNFKLDKSLNDGYPNIHLIQDFLDGSNTLYNIIDTDPNFSLETLKNYISQVFSQLAILQESKFKLTHNDLSINNIMIKGNKAYIIDFGCASFTHNQERFRGETEKQMFDVNIIKSDYISVIADVFLFICSIKNSIEHNQKLIEIKKYIDDILDMHFFKKIQKIMGKTIKYDFQEKMDLVYKEINSPKSTTKLNTITSFNIYPILLKYKLMNELNLEYFKNFTYDYALKNVFQVQRIELTRY